jgi:dienelactone hydrolase
MPTNTVQTQTIRYNVGEREFVGHLAWDDAVSGKRPGVLVVPEWWGLNDFARGRANELAKLGYVAFACDLYGGGKVAQHPVEAGQLVKQLTDNPKEWQKRANASLDLLKQEPHCDAIRLAAIGYCFGGSTALVLACSGADLGAVVTFHASVQAPTAEQAGAIKASVVVCHGNLDTFTPDETMLKFRKALDDANVDYEVDYYGGAKHGFAVPDADKRGMPSLGYNQKAAARSWNRMLALFDEKFGKVPLGGAPS